MVKIGGYTQERGYLWKLCPYSDAYASAFYDRHYLGTSPGFTHSVTDSETGEHLYWEKNAGITTSEHSYTNGTMNMITRGAGGGWICLDDDCWYFTTYGKRYHEI